MLLFACPDSNDNTNDDDNNQVVFTATNYLYEGDLRIYFLETRNTALETQIEIWQQVPDSDPGYNDAQQDIAAANAEIVSNNNEAVDLVYKSDSKYKIEILSNSESF